MTTQLDSLMDAGAIMRELGITRNAADVLMRQLTKQKIPGLKKNYVRRADVERLLRENVHDVITTRARQRRSAA